MRDGIPRGASVSVGFRLLSLSVSRRRFAFCILWIWSHNPPAKPASQRLWIELDNIYIPQWGQRERERRRFCGRRKDDPQTILENIYIFYYFWCVDWDDAKRMNDDGKNAYDRSVL